MQGDPKTRLHSLSNKPAHIVVYKDVTVSVESDQVPDVMVRHLEILRNEMRDFTVAFSELSSRSSVTSCWCTSL